MPRKNLIRSSSLPYHVTIRCNNREAFHSPLENVWQTFSFHIFEIEVLFGALVHAFVLMNNHLHLLLTTPHENLGEVMQQFCRSSTLQLNLISGRSGRAFGARYHWTLIDSQLYYRCVYKYIYRNPVRAGCAFAVEDYVFSTISGLVGKSPLPFPLHFPLVFNSLPENIDEQLRWLNEPFQIEQEATIKRTLRKTLFRPAKVDSKRKKSILDSIA